MLSWINLCIVQVLKKPSILHNPMGVVNVLDESVENSSYYAICIRVSALVLVGPIVSRSKQNKGGFITIPESIFKIIVWKRNFEKISCLKGITLDKEARWRIAQIAPLRMPCHFMARLKANYYFYSCAKLLCHNWEYCRWIMMVWGKGHWLLPISSSYFSKSSPTVWGVYRPVP